MIKWAGGDWSNESLIDYFENDSEDEQHDVEYPKQTLQCIAMALIRIAYAIEEK